jgi:anti-anti-sigma factor
LTDNHHGALLRGKQPDRQLTTDRDSKPVCRRRNGMSVYTLTRVRIGPAGASRAMRLAARLGHRLERQRGFLSLQLYQAKEEPETCLALAEWDSAASHERVLRDAEVARLLAQMDERCTVEPARRMEPLFHIHFPRRSSTVALARLARAHSDAAEAMKAADKDAGLKAMALPGSVGVFGGQCSEDPRLSFCRIEFDGEETLRRYLGSAMHGQWHTASGPLVEEATWWRKEERLEYWRVERSDRPAGDTEQRAEVAGTLSLEIETVPGENAAILRFHGRMGPDATAKFVKVRDALIRGGCLRLTLDLSDLGYIASPGLQALLATAKRLKEAGGHLTVIDNEGRFNRILRALHLERALAVRRAQEGGSSASLLT